MTRALRLVVSNPPAQDLITRDYCRALVATWSWGVCPTLDSYFLARSAWQRVEGDWLRLMSGSR